MLASCWIWTAHLISHGHRGKIVKLPLYRPGQTLKCKWCSVSENFQTVGTRSWKGFQSHAPVAFTPPENIPSTHFCYRLFGPQCHSAAGNSMSNIFSDPTQNRTPDLPTCSAMPQATASLPLLWASSLLSQGVKPLLWATPRAAGVKTTVSYS